MVYVRESLAEIRLLRPFWGHAAGTKGWLRQTLDGSMKYIKLPYSPRAFVRPEDEGKLYMVTWKNPDA